MTIDIKIGRPRRTAVMVMDAPGDGGANHKYLVVDPAQVRERTDFTGPGGKILADICFQDGPIPENGVNGVTQEDLLSIVIHRLRGFDKGPFATRENACALRSVEEALHWLEARTYDREQRGVEGTHNP